MICQAYSKFQNMVELTGFIIEVLETYGFYVGGNGEDKYIFSREAVYIFANGINSEKIKIFLDLHRLEMKNLRKTFKISDERKMP